MLKKKPNIRAVLLLQGFILCQLMLTAQTKLSLKLDNYHPRVGDKIKVALGIDFFGEMIKSQLGDDAFIDQPSYPFDALGKQAVKTISFKQSGVHSIGPFSFEFNGTSYITDAITLVVPDKLSSKKEGVYVRLSSNKERGDQNNTQYLIIEQFVKSEAKIDSLTKLLLPSEPEKKLVELRSLNSESIKFGSSVSKTYCIIGCSDVAWGALNLDGTPNIIEKETPVKMFYSFKKYKLTILNSLKEPIILTENNFNNYPPDIEFKPITINK